MKREELYLVSKVLPNHAGKGKLETALDNSLMRMGVEQLDLYLYHWRGSYPLEETVAIPRSARAEYSLQNAAADRIKLSEEDYQAIDGAFPKPVRKEYLDMQ